MALSIGTVDDELARVDRARRGVAAASGWRRLPSWPTRGCGRACWWRRSCPGISDGEEQLGAPSRGPARRRARGTSCPIVLHLRPGVREHYLEWLEGEHPELLDEHHRRYDGRAYLPRADGQRVALVVREEFDRARTRSGATRSRKRRSWVTTSRVPA